MRLDDWIPMAVAQGTEQRVRARVFIASVWLLAALILIAAIVRFNASPMSGASIAAVGTAVLLLVCAPWILRRSGQLTTTALILPSILLCLVLVVASENGGIQAPVIIAAPLVPVTAAYFCGWRAGLLYTAAVFALLAELLSQYLAGNAAPPPFETAEQLWWVRAVVTACVVAFLVGIACLYDLQRRTATAELVSSEARYRLAAAAGKELAFTWSERAGFQFSQAPANLFPGIPRDKSRERRRGLEQVLSVDEQHRFDRAWSAAVAVSADFAHCVAIQADDQAQGVLHVLASPQAGPDGPQYHGVLRRLDPGLTIGDQDLRILPELIAGLRQEQAIVRKNLQMQAKDAADPTLQAMLRASAEEALQRASEMLDRTQELLEPAPRSALVTVERFGLRPILTQTVEQFRAQELGDVQWRDQLPTDSEMHGQARELGRALAILIREAGLRSAGQIQLHSEARGAHLWLRIRSKQRHPLARAPSKLGASRTALRTLHRQQAQQILRLHGGDLRQNSSSDPSLIEVVLPYRPMTPDPGTQDLQPPLSATENPKLAR